MAVLMVGTTTIFECDIVEQFNRQHISTDNN